MFVFVYSTCSTSASTEPLGSCFQNSACLLYVPGDTVTFEHIWKIASEIGGALKNIHLCQLNSFLLHMLQWKWWVNATVCLISCALLVRWPIYHRLWCFNCFNGSNGGDHIRSKQLITGYCLSDAFNILAGDVVYDRLTACISSLSVN